MLRPEELAPVLTAVRAAISEVLKPDLTSDHTRSVADAVLLSLDRAVMSVRGDAIAEPRIDTWSNIHATLAADGATATGVHGAAESAGHGCDRSSFLGAVRGLLHEVDDIQVTLGSEAILSALIEGLRSRDPNIQAWFGRAVRALCDLHDAAAPAFVDMPSARPAAPNSPVDEASRLQTAMNRYLRARYSGLPEAAVTSVRLVPGGYSKQTALFSLVPNAHLPERVVMRRDVAHGVTPGSVANEYPFIVQAFKAGVRTPEPLLLETDPTPLGGTFMLMREVPDARTSATYFPEDRVRGPHGTSPVLGPEFGREVAATLAHLHSRTRVARLAAVPDYNKLALESRAVWSGISPKTPLSLSMELCYAWLASHPVSADRPYCTVHGDFSMHNILVRDGHLAAVVDWELAAIGDPADDLAQCRMLLTPGIIEWPEFVAGYVAAGGDPLACDPEAVSYFCVALFGKHCVNHGVLRKAFIAGERSDIGAATLISHYADRVLQYQSRALRIAIESSGTSFSA
jgi:aminoglycoside phosphotransferase (APT) family kinase protein